MIIQNKPIPACALLETSVSIASASLLFPPAVIVTQVIFFAQLGSFLFGSEIGRIKKHPVRQSMKIYYLDFPHRSCRPQLFLCRRPPLCRMQVSIVMIILLSMIILIILLLKIIIIITIIILILKMIIFLH